MTEVERICLAALDRPAEERAAFLDDACNGDEALRHDVESLLAHASSAEQFIEHPAVAGAGALAGLSGLSIGQRLGPYHIIAKLGAGGMGEVYRAHDTQLGREVAIKILPAVFVADPERLARFEREARILASLNHPHIGAIYGVEAYVGGDGVRARALILELVAGATLADRLAGGALDMRQALTLAAQIAEALEAAHDRGVIHRDLKPANITVTPEGNAKVLDFGLARSDGAGGPMAGPTQAETIGQTREGAILGTATYMSPEQARGLAVDKRTDIWAFGCVVQEMLTGRPAFPGTTVSDTIAAILEREPAFEALPADTPPGIRRLLARCLTKDSRRRLRDIGEARIIIEEILSGAAPAETTMTGERTLTRRTAVGALIGAAVVMLAGLGGWWVATGDDRRADGAVVRLTLPSMGAAQPALPFGVRHLAISKDGSRVAYAGTELRVRRIDQRQPVAVAASATNPFFSPDGRWLAFFGLAAGLMKVPVSGGAPVTIVATTDRPAGGTWGPDGTIVFATSEGLYRVSQDGGAATLLAKPDASRQERAFAWPQFMPDGQSVLFTILKEGSIDEAQVTSLVLRTGQRKVVLTGGTAAQYTPRGDLVYASGTHLKVAAFDLANTELRREPVAASDIVIGNTLDNGAAEFALADNGTLIFTSGNTMASPLRTVLWVDRAGREEVLPLPPDAYQYPRISPDGSLVALDVSGANRDIWIWNLVRKHRWKLTDGPNEDLLPLWGVDGQRLFFSSNRANNMDIYSQAADGATPAHVEFSAPGTQFPNAFTPDGTKLLVYQEFKDLEMLDLAHPDRLQPLLHSRIDAKIGGGAISPDGHWLAHEANESDRYQVVVRSFPDVTRRREQVSTNGGRFPLWGKSGRELFYVDPDGVMMSAEVGPALTIGKVTPIFRTDKPPAGDSGRPYDISPIDGRFLITRAAPASADAAVEIGVVLNWFTELRQRSSDALR